MKNTLLLIMLFITTSCAFGPLMMNETARTVGKGNGDINFGYGLAGYVVKYNYGLLKDLDIGIQYEALSIGVRAKYAFINNQEKGFSLAAALGTGASLGGSHNYADLIASYKNERFEPYFGYRYVSVKTDPVEFEDNEDDDVIDLSFLRIDSFKYKYGQAFLGFKYWFTDKWNFTSEISKLVSIEDVTLRDSGFLYAASFTYKFM